jgi:hypothetical protein
MAGAMVTAGIRIDQFRPVIFNNFSPARMLMPEILTKILVKVCLKWLLLVVSHFIRNSYFAIYRRNKWGEPH